MVDSLTNSLMIQKDVELNRALVTKVKRDNPNLIEQVFGGVLLVQKVIERGQVIFEQSDSTLPFWEICKMMFVDPVTKKGSLGVYAVLSFCTSAALYLHIFLFTFLSGFYKKELPTNFFFGTSPETDGPFRTTYLSETDLHKVHVILIVSVVVYVSLAIATTWYAKNIRANKITISAAKSGAWFMGMSYRFVESNFFHSLVDRFSSDASVMNFEVLPKYISMVDQAMEYTAIALTLTALLSVWSSIFIQGIFVLIFYKVVYPSRIGYIKLQKIKIGYQGKLDQLHYQLLNLISDCRLSKQLNLVMAKIEGLQNKLSVIETADKLIFRKMTMTIITWMAILLVFMIYSVRFLMLLVPGGFYLLGDNVIIYMNLFC